MNSAVADSTAMQRCRACGALGAAAGRLVCRPCWESLPADLRTAFHRAEGHDQRRQCAAAVFEYLHDHPRRTAMQIDIDGATAFRLETLVGSAEEALTILAHTAADGVADPSSWQRGWLMAAGLLPIKPIALDGVWLRSERERLCISRDTLAARIQVSRNEIIRVERAPEPVPPAWLPGLRRQRFRSAPHAVAALDQERFALLFKGLTRMAALSPLHPRGDGETYTCAFCDVDAELPTSHDARDFPHAYPCFWVEAQKLQPPKETP